MTEARGRTVTLILAGDSVGKAVTFMLHPSSNEPMCLPIPLLDYEIQEGGPEPCGPFTFMSLLTDTHTRSVYQGDIPSQGF